MKVKKVKRNKKFTNQFKTSEGIFFIKRETIKKKRFYVVRNTKGKIQSLKEPQKGDTLEKLAIKFNKSNTLDKEILNFQRINKNLKVFTSKKRLTFKTKTQIGVYVQWFKGRKFLGTTQGFSNKLNTRTYSKNYKPIVNNLGKKLTVEEARQQAFNRALGRATEQGLFKYDDMSIRSRRNFFFRSYGR